MSCNLLTIIVYTIFEYKKRKTTGRNRKGPTKIKVNNSHALDILCKQVLGKHSSLPAHPAVSRINNIKLELLWGVTAA